jgi:hypothetical protein
MNDAPAHGALSRFAVKSSLLTYCSVHLVMAAALLQLPVILSHFVMCGTCEKIIQAGWLNHRCLFIKIFLGLTRGFPRFSPFIGTNMVTRNPANWMCNAKSDIINVNK